jgi:hypothetical protein
MRLDQATRKALQGLERNDELPRQRPSTGGVMGIFQQGMGQQSPAVLNILRRLGGKPAKSSSAKRSAGGSLREYKVKSKKRAMPGTTLKAYKVKSKMRKSPNIPKFGSPAWRKKYMKKARKSRS